MDSVPTFLPPPITPVARKRPALDNFSTLTFKNTSGDDGERPLTTSALSCREANSNGSYRVNMLQSGHCGNSEPQGNCEGDGALSQDKPHDHELRQIITLCQGLQDRHHQLIHQISLMQQTIVTSSAKLSLTEQKLDEERAVYSRSHKHCIELQSLTAAVLSK